MIECKIIESAITEMKTFIKADTSFESTANAYNNGIRKCVGILENKIVH